MTPYHEVPFSTFYNDLLPGKNISNERLNNLLHPESDPDGEYFAFIRTITRIAQLDSSQYAFKDLVAWYEAAGRGRGYHPAIALYPTDTWNAPKYAVAYDTLEEAAICESSRDLVAQSRYGMMVTAFDVRHVDDEPAFGMQPGMPLLPDTVGAHESRARFEHFASKLMHHQFRTHVFMFYLDGKSVRAFRWDRSGALVSPPMLFEEDPKDLWNIIYRLVGAGKKTQGFDSTVAYATFDDTMASREMDEVDEALQEYRDLFDEDSSGAPLCKVVCDEVLESGGSRSTRSAGKKTLLFRGSMLSAPDVTGNGTKAWVAYCLEDRNLVLLKEQWRIYAPGTHAEIETYQRLRLHGVRNIATAIAGGDVIGPLGPQKTLSQQYASHDRPPVPVRIQTRLVLKEFGRQLDAYKNSKELITFTTHALVAHKDAWEKAGILHGDVSPRNILIDAVAYSKGSLQGLLIDWESCKYKEELENNLTSTSNGLLGTWAFASALALKYPRRPTGLADDLESFLYIPTYYAFRNHVHSRTMRRDLEDNPDPCPETDDARISHSVAMSQFFRMQHQHENGMSSGGDIKLNRIRWGRPPVRLSRLEDAPLNDLLKRGFTLLRQHYQDIDYDALSQFLAEPPELPAGSSERKLARSSPTSRDSSPSKKGEPVATPSAPAQQVDPTQEESAQEVSLPLGTGSTGAEGDPTTVLGGMPTRPLDTHAALLEIFETVVPRPKLRLVARIGKKELESIVKVEEPDNVPLPRLRHRKPRSPVKCKPEEAEAAAVPQAKPLKGKTSAKKVKKARKLADDVVEPLPRLRPRIGGSTKRKAPEASDDTPLARLRPRKRQRQQ